ncbi:glycosyltransferase [Actinotalea sp. JY-7885]|uniref:glycosyltransferase n=1 Tax=Actinotalea sp. JY-7885 TaxID=2758576 RepID=UPI00165D413C|nr:glycosyltransferase [Actinotalea sp. JY-7885]
MPDVTHMLVAPSSELKIARAEGTFASLHALPDGHLSRLRTLKAVLAALEPDLVHAHSSLAGVYARLVAQCPVVYQPHCFKFTDPSLSRLRALAIRAVEMCFARRTRVTVALTPHEERTAAELGASVVARLTNVPSTVHLGTDVPAEAPRPRVVTMIGRVTEQKDPRFFADIAALARVELPELRFRWVGAGEDELERALSDAEVEVTGWLDPARVAGSLRESWVYMHTASYEGFPLAVLDAAAAGLPIVVRPIDAFDGTTLRRVGSAAQAVEVLRRLVYEEDEYASAKRISRDLADSATPVKQRDQLLSIYEIAVRPAVGIGGAR